MKAIQKIGYWFKNYWYYYKWPVIIVSFFAVVILICTLQAGNRETYDVSILYTGPHIFVPAEKSSLSSAFSQIMSEDYDGDGRKKVDIVDTPAFTDEQIREAVGTSDDPALSIRYAPYTVSNVEGTFTQRVFAGDTVLCLVDEYWYKLLLDSESLVKLEVVIGYRPEELADDYSAYFSDLAFASFFSFSLPEGTRVCFRKISTASAFTGRKAAEANYKRSEKMLCDLFGFQIPEPG